MKDFYYIFRNKEQVVKHAESLKIKDIDYKLNDKLTKRIHEIKENILYSLPEHENIEYFYLNGTHEYIGISFIYKDKPSCEHCISIQIRKEDFFDNRISINYNITDITYAYFNEERIEHLEKINSNLFTKIKHIFFNRIISRRAIRGKFTVSPVYLFYKIFFFAHKKRIKDITKLIGLRHYNEFYQNVSPCSWGFNTIYKDHNLKQDLACFLKSDNEFLNLLMETYRLLLIKDDHYNKISNKDIILLLEEYKNNLFIKSKYSDYRYFNQNNFKNILDILKISDGYNQDAKNLLDLQYQF